VASFRVLQPCTFVLSFAVLCLLLVEQYFGDIGQVLVDCWLLVDDCGIDELEFGPDLVGLSRVEGIFD